MFDGATSLAKIARFITNYDPQLRRFVPGTVWSAASALRRLLTRLDADALDTITCSHLAWLGAWTAFVGTSSFLPTLAGRP
ncbi:hypothetical protein AB0I81_15895 [Nonomuraea sp. NPDC050404]|uniref:hypothetical protein n=1 Tax=Nonomuraea sp. NPDC050404 TaxID=3155783 RepID=UPI0033FF4922